MSRADRQSVITRGKAPGELWLSRASRYTEAEGLQYLVTQPSGSEQVLRGWALALAFGKSRVSGWEVLSLQEPPTALAHLALYPPLLCPQPLAPPAELLTA